IDFGERGVNELAHFRDAGFGKREVEIDALLVASAAERVVADIDIAHKRKQFHRKGGRTCELFKADASEQGAERRKREIVEVMRRRDPPGFNSGTAPERFLELVVVVRDCYTNKTAG